MRRWNGWGDDATGYSLPGGAFRFLAARLGESAPPKEASFEDVLKTVPDSRLPPHPLVNHDPVERVRHARGQSMPDWVALRSGRVGVFPDGVAYPMSAEDVRALIRYAAETGARLIPYGGGTSVVGHINPLPGDRPVLTVNMSRMNRLERLDETTLLATFGAGVSGPDLEAQLRARGYTLGHYPQSFECSTLGGWIAARSSGQQSLYYGRIESLFVGGQVETPGGHLALPNVPASAAGPNLREIVLGSEGRLGIITEATVRVSPLPEREEFSAVFFPHFENGLTAVREIVQTRLPLSMLRLSTAVETETTLALAGHERLIGVLERYLSLRGAKNDKCLLVFAFTGGRALGGVTIKETLRIAGARGGVHVGDVFGRQWQKSRFRTPYLRNTLWERGYAVDTLETATTWTNTPTMITAIETALRGALADLGERIHVFTHLSHVYPHGTSVYTTYVFRLASDADETLRRWLMLKKAASEAVVANGGTISHQHGVGIDHAPYLAAEKGEAGMKALRDVLASFDPEGVMNPGKLIVP